MESLTSKFVTAEDGLGYLDFLHLLVQYEIERIESKKLSLRLSRASFEEGKSIEGFDFTFNPKVNHKLIRDLAACAFVEKGEHVLLYGPAGTGKSHIAQALGHQACRKGYHVLFTKAVKLFLPPGGEALMGETNQEVPSPRSAHH